MLVRGWWLGSLIAALALFAAACGDSDGGDATPTPDDGDEATPAATSTATTDGAAGLILLEGVFETGFEHSAFYPEVECPAEGGRYWVSWTPESRFDERIVEETGVQPFAEPDVRTFRIALRGELSPPGEYGHLGAYPRELTVHELISAESATDCGEPQADDNDADSGGGTVPPPDPAPRRCSHTRTAARSRSASAATAGRRRTPRSGCAWTRSGSSPGANRWP